MLARKLMKRKCLIQVFHIHRESTISFWFGAIVLNSVCKRSVTFFKRHAVTLVLFGEDGELFLKRPTIYLSFVFTGKRNFLLKWRHKWKTKTPCRANTKNHAVSVQELVVHVAQEHFLCPRNVVISAGFLVCVYTWFFVKRLSFCQDAIVQV